MGYKGFSDYTVIEKDLKNGWLPYAISIHTVFFDESMNLKIKHFTSESNLDTSNQAKKFFEAAKKLCEWILYNKIDTYGIKKLINYYENKLNIAP